MEPANRLQNANGPWGAKTFYYDGVGNRTQEVSTVGGTTTTDVYGYPATSNRLVQITRGASTIRSLAYDNGGNLTSDSGAGISRGYAYNALACDLLRCAEPRVGSQVTGATACRRRPSAPCSGTTPP